MAQSIESVCLGPPPPDYQRLFDASLECFHVLLGAAAPGVPYADLIRLWGEHMEKAGLRAAPTMGHGLGLGQDGPTHAIRRGRARPRRRGRTLLHPQTVGDVGGRHPRHSRRQLDRCRGNRRAAPRTPRHGFSNTRVVCLAALGVHDYSDGAGKIINRTRGETHAYRRRLPLAATSPTKPRPTRIGWSFAIAPIVRPCRGRLSTRVVQVPEDKFTLKSGTLKMYVKTAESGNKRPRCSAPTAEPASTPTSVDDPPDGAPKIFGIRLGTVGPARGPAAEGPDLAPLGAPLARRARLDPAGGDSIAPTGGKPRRAADSGQDKPTCIFVLFQAPSVIARVETSSPGSSCLGTNTLIHWGQE